MLLCEAGPRSLDTRTLLWKRVIIGLFLSDISHVPLYHPSLGLRRTDATAAAASRGAALLIAGSRVWRLSRNNSLGGHHMACGISGAGHGCCLKRTQTCFSTVHHGANLNKAAGNLMLLCLSVYRKFNYAFLLFQVILCMRHLTFQTPLPGAEKQNHILCLRVCM